MKIKIMTTDAINYVKGNIDKVLFHYKNGDNPLLWINSAIGHDAFVDVPELEFEDFELLSSPDAPASNDIDNIKLLYGKMKDLNDSFASDERLWAGLSHTVFYDYMLKRWAGSQNSCENVLNHFFFKGGRPRCYMINTIARLWWIGKKTINYRDDDPYRILDFMAHDINGYGFTLFGSNWSNSENTLNLFFDGIFRFEEETNNRVGRELFNDAMKYTNCLCGTYMLDACDDSFVSDSVFNYLIIRSKERSVEAEYNKINNIRSTGIAKIDNIIRAINKLGGHGKLKEILNAYEEVTQEKVSLATRSYIINSIENNSPDSAWYKGKPIFYKLQAEGGGAYWKISNDYLTKDNMPIRKKLMNDGINSLPDDARIVFNFITSFSTNKFIIDDILQYKQQISDIYPEIVNVQGFVKNGIKTLRQKGLIELMDGDTYKKSFNIKIN